MDYMNEWEEHDALNAKSTDSLIKQSFPISSRSGRNRAGENLNKNPWYLRYFDRTGSDL